MASSCERLRNVRILVVEDDFLIAWELMSIFTGAGAKICGPCASLGQALALAADADISVAILDVRLGRETAAPVARVLRERGIPFFFYTGQVRNDPFWHDWPDARVLAKPASASALIAMAAACNDQIHSGP
ncbi:MAG: response regulator [Hyphomicrobiales bacterium]|nr:response regulator [Hyphomicrobiales bacterium]